MGDVTALAYGPRYLASGNDEGTIQLWDHETLKCVATMRPSFEAVSALAYGPRYWYLAQLEADGDTIRLWDFYPVRLAQARLTMLPFLLVMQRRQNSAFHAGSTDIQRVFRFLL